MSGLNKIIGIGLPKTGTSSLNVALNNNGVPSIHFGDPECDEVREKIYQGVYKFDLFEKYRCITNAFEMLFPQLDTEYPGSKFIYTIFDKLIWMKSVREHWEGMLSNKVSKPMQVHHHLITFGTYLFSEDRFSFVYDMHAQMVSNYFKERPADLLVLDLSKNNNWVAETCSFLDTPMIDPTLVHTNKKSFT